MAKGDGGIRQIKRNGKPIKDAQGRFVWEVRISTGWDSASKKYGLITKRVHGNKSDARKLRDELNEQLANGIDPNAGKVSFGEYARKWLSVHIVLDNIAENTVTYYEHMQSRVAPFIGDVPLKGITANKLDEMYCRLLSDGLSSNSVRKIHGYVKTVLKHAVDHDAILRNPADKARPPKSEKTEIRVLSPIEAATLRERIEDAERAAYESEQAKESRCRDDGSYERGYMRGLLDISCCIAARIALASGMRRGEVLALRWCDIDLERGMVSVRHSITTSMTVKNPKSEAGIRSLAIYDVAVKALAQWREFQYTELSKIGVNACDETPVCCDSTGGYICPNNFSRWWRKFAKDNGFAGLRFHSLRHAHATLLVGLGCDSKTVQTRLGHSDTSTTLNMYTHPLEENDRAAAEMLGRLLENPSDARIIPFRKTA